MVVGAGGGGAGEPAADSASPVGLGQRYDAKEWEGRR